MNARLASLQNIAASLVGALLFTVLLASTAVSIAPIA